MRLAAQMKGGFYPVHEDVIAFAAGFLRPPPNRPFSLLDPCAGEGSAIVQLGRLLNCPSERLFAIELDESRAARVHAVMPEARVLAPANFFGCRATPNRFSLIWLNPPFDNGYGNYRVEQHFLTTATDWLMQGGVMAFVCPEDVVSERSAVRRHFATYYQDCQVVPFPEQRRSFKEVIVFGRKRAKPQADVSSRQPSWESVQAPAGFVYDIPPGVGPRFFQKIEPTEPELTRMLANSPLRSHLTVTPDSRMASPPLSLGIGHVALLLASGQLDGVVHPDGQQPHVVRGTSRKSEFVSDVTEVENADGSTSTKTTISQKIELVIRTVGVTGNIHTFMDTDAKEDQLK